MSKRDVIPYLRWGKKRIAFLMYLAEGKTRQEIAEILDTNIRTIESWFADEAFKAAEQAIFNNPIWFHVHIASPLMLASQDRLFLESFLVHGKSAPRLNGKEKELLLQEMNLINPDETGDVGDKLLAIMQQVRFAPPATATHTPPGGETITRIAREVESA